MDNEGNNQKKVSSDYVVGLVDGEGCFYVNVYDRDKKKYPNSKPQTRVHLYIKLREDDLIILEKVQKTLGFGFIYYQKDTRGNHSACYRYEVNARDDLKKLIKFFDSHPLQSPKKHRDFLIVKKILKIVDSGKHLTKDGISEIRQLKSQMHI